MEAITIPLRPILIFVVVLARVGGLVTFAPFWSHRAAPAPVRAVLAAMLALVITPVVLPRLATPPTEPVAFALVLLGELCVGLVFGLVGRFVFSALEVAAQVLGYQMGLSLAATIDPATRAQTAALGTIAQMLGLVLLLGADGHYWFLAASVRSYETLAPGGSVVTPAMAELLVRLSADALAAGVALAAPAIVVLLTVELALAIAGRVAPQLQILMLGFPVKIAVGLWLIGVSVYALPGAIRDVLAAMKSGLARALGAM
jgi:flagellar biosynthetic protein FliR